MANNIVRVWGTKTIRQREDGYLSATDMAQANGKKINDWLRLKSTKSFLDETSSVTGIPVTELVQGLQGGNPEDQGTWIHPDIAPDLGTWCSIPFRVQVNQWIKELLTKGVVSIAPGEKVFTLEMAVRRDPMDWEQLFMSSWIAEAERLTGWKWTWKAMSHFINATVYAYLPVDVATLLRGLRNSQDKTVKLHQFLQPEIREIVFDHLNKVEDLMRAAKGNLSLFELLMSNYFGRYKLVESEKDQMSLFSVETKYLPISAPTK